MCVLESFYTHYTGVVWVSAMFKKLFDKKAGKGSPKEPEAFSPAVFLRAIEKNQVPVINAILSDGKAQERDMTAKVNARDNEGHTPLNVAVQFADIGVVKALVEVRFGGTVCTSVPAFESSAGTSGVHGCIA